MLSERYLERAYPVKSDNVIHNARRAHGELIHRHSQFLKLINTHVEYFVTVTLGSV